MYDSFFRPYVSKHENEIDRNLLELRTRAGDMAILYWQRAASYGQTRIYEILQFVAAQSTPRTRPPLVVYKDMILDLFCFLFVFFKPLFDNFIWCLVLWTNTLGTMLNLSLVSWKEIVRAKLTFIFFLPISSIFVMLFRMLSFSVLQLQNISLTFCKWYIIGVVCLSVTLGLFFWCAVMILLQKYNRPMLPFVLSFGLEVNVDYQLPLPLY